MGNWAFNEYFSNAITKEGLKGLVEGEKNLDAALKICNLCAKFIFPKIWQEQNNNIVRLESSWDCKSHLQVSGTVFLLISARPQIIVYR